MFPSDRTEILTETLELDSVTIVPTKDDNAIVVVQPDDVNAYGSKLSEKQALMSFIKSNIGTGMLSMPVALKYCGLWTGLILILASGLICGYLMHVLVRTARSVTQKHNLDRSKMDYTEATFLVFKYGPESLRKSKGKIKHTINVFLLITQIGMLCIYLLFVTENIRYFFLSFYPNRPLNFYLTGFTITLLLIPLTWWEDLRLLAQLSMVANLATLLGTILIFVYIFSTGLQPYTMFPAYTNLRSALVGFGIVVFAFEGISLVLPIQNQMTHPEGYTQFSGVLNMGMTVIVCLCGLVGFFGFLNVGDSVQGSITLTIPERPYWFAPIKPLFVVAILFSYLLQYYVPATIFARLMEKLRCHREASKRRRFIHVKAMRVSLVLFTYLMVITIPKLELMISLVGALASSVLAFIMPAVLEMVHLWPERKLIRHFWLTVVTKDTICILIGLVAFVGGTISTLMQLVQSFGLYTSS